MSIYTPFTYLITHIPTGKRYYGVRYQKGCHPSDIGTKYFSSSNVIKKMIAEDGLDKFKFEVRRTFDNADKATRWERRVHLRMKVHKNDDWLNIHVASGTCRGRSKEVKQSKIQKCKKQQYQKRTSCKNLSRLMNRILLEFEKATSGKNYSKEILDKIYSFYLRKFMLQYEILKVRRILWTSVRVKKLPYINQIKC